MQIEQSVRYLKFASGITLATGLMIAAAAVPALNAPTVVLLDLVFFPVDGAQTMFAGETRLFSAISGGVLAGWGLMIWLLATELYAGHPELGRRLILRSVAVWFVVDSSMSVAAGAPLNVLGNVVFLLLFVVPVWKPVPPRRAAA
ncbi:MAG: excinuclease ABC subunit A [Pseudomonadota bacterium]